MKIEKQRKTIKNYIYNTEPDDVLVVTQKESDINIINDAKSLLTTIKTNGFKVIFEEISNSIKNYENKIFNVKAETVEGINYQREEMIHKRKSLLDILHWIEGRLIESERIVEEWSKGKKGGTK